MEIYTEATSEATVPLAGRGTPVDAVQRHCRISALAAAIRSNPIATSALSP